MRVLAVTVTVLVVVLALAACVPAAEEAAAAAEDDLYGVLGVARTATPAELKRAYRSRAAQWHPDRHAPAARAAAAAHFVAVTRAYETLADPQRRAAYDRGARAGPAADAHLAHVLLRHAAEVFAETFGHAAFSGVDGGPLRMDGTGDENDDNDHDNDAFQSPAEEQEQQEQQHKEKEEEEEEAEYVYVQSPEFEGMKIRQRVRGLFAGTEVHVLTRANMDRLVHGADSGLWLVLFYDARAWADAAAFARTFAGLARPLRDVAALGAVDCAGAGGAPLCARHDVAGARAELLLFCPGRAAPVRHPGVAELGVVDADADAAALGAWVAAHVPDRVQRVTDASLAAFAARTAPFVRALLFTRAAAPPLRLRALAVRLRGRAVVALADPRTARAAAAALGVTHTPTLVAVFAGPDTARHNVYHGPRTYAAVARYLRDMCDYDAERLAPVDDTELRDAAVFLDAVDKAAGRGGDDDGDDDAAPPVQELTRTNFEDALLSVHTAVVYFTPGGKIPRAAHEFLRGLARRHAHHGLWLFWADGTKMARFHDHFPLRSCGSSDNEAGAGEVLFLVPSANKYFWAPQVLEDVDAALDRWADGDTRWCRYAVLPQTADLYA